MTATKPAIAPPNQALPMTAPKNRKTNGYAITCCSGKVHNNATITEQTAMEHGFTTYSNLLAENRPLSAFVMLAS